MIGFIPPSLRTGFADLPTSGSPVGGYLCEDWRTNSWAAASTATHIWQSSFIIDPRLRGLPASVPFQAGGADRDQYTLKCCHHWVLSEKVSRCRHSLIGVCPAVWSSTDSRRTRSGHVSTFLHPFAPPALPGFVTPMGALTPARRCTQQSFTACAVQVSPLNAFVHREPSVSNHPTASHDRFGTYQLSAVGILFAQVWASPFPSGLATQHGRNEFTLLRTTLSPPVAPHPTSR
jgi:hypothetical protein